MSWTIALAISNVLLGTLCIGLYLCNRDLEDALRREERTSTSLRKAFSEEWGRSCKWQDLYCRADNQLKAVRDALDIPPSSR